MSFAGVQNLYVLKELIDRHILGIPSLRRITVLFQKCSASPSQCSRLLQRLLGFMVEQSPNHLFQGVLK